ncbi:MAG: hypothetical protein CMM46_17180 [Rhodospirillaceae bacterium]|nr:hypothetical protein [Rhodospirillaceae bacterium]|tara:strand:- start:1098 stop:2228 length:1131 start_codon:yes stop_codon:yes gene_type:complete
MNRRNPALAALLALVLLLSPALAEDEESPLPVRIDTVLEEIVSETALVIGRFVSRQAGVVAAQSEGAVQDVLVDIGDRVAAGDPMVLLVADRLALNREIWAAEVLSAEALLGVAHAELALAQQELVRLESLMESAAFSQARFDDSQQRVAIGEAGVAVARAELLSAQANMALAQDELADATITAPYDAVVTVRHTEVGGYVDVGESVISLMNDGWVEIEADVPSSRVSALSEGTAVRLTLDDGTQKEAFVRAVGVSEDPQARTRLVRFTPAWEVMPGTLAQGQSVTLSVPAGPQTDVITVHKDAVIRSAGQTLVYVAVMEEGSGDDSEIRAQERKVTLGSGLGNRFVVLDGLAPGDLAVVLGNEALSDQTLIVISP